MNKIILTVLLGLVAGCATVAPHYDAKFGDAVRAARQAQTVNLGAAADGDAVQSLDGKAAVKAIDRYEESFKSPPKTFEVINIGGGSVGN